MNMIKAYNNIYHQSISLCKIKIKNTTKEKIFHGIPSTHYFQQFLIYH